jgi:hypothetical protein
VSLPARVAWHLRAQRATLVADWDHWVARVKPGGKLEQHHSQVHRIRTQLEEALKTALGAAGPDPASATLDSLEDARRAIDVLHLIWGFFRDKLAQRDSPRHAPYLLIADDLAWACYEPFRRAYVEARRADATRPGRDTLREPPLVFHAPERSPFAQARASSFVPSGLAANDVSVFQAVLQRLPVPIIGVPDPVAVRVPPLVFVGHEIGHVVGEDLGLLAEARERLAALGIDAARKKVWSRWLDEVFADVFGVLATGSAYVDQLAAVLAGSVSGVRNERIGTRGKNGDVYPTRVLRMAICHRAIERLVGDAYVKARLPSLRTWTDTYGDLTGDSGAYRNDVPEVVDSLLAGYAALGPKGLGPKGLGPKGLSDVLPWDADAEASVATTAQEHLECSHPPVPYSVRVWVAAAARAHEDDPTRYGDKSSRSGTDCDGWVARSIQSLRKSGVRAELPEEGQEIEDLNAFDMARGRALATLLGSAPTREDG